MGANSLTNSLLVVKFHLALMKCPCYRSRHFIKFNEDINKIHSSMILLGKSGFGCEKYAFQNQVIGKKFPGIKLEQATLCFFPFLVTSSYTSSSSSFSCPFLFVSFLLLLAPPFFTFFIFYISVFMPLLLGCPGPQNCIISVLNMLRCVGIVKKPGEKLLCTKVCSLTNSLYQRVFNQY
jgi:hypothetical protein